MFNMEIQLGATTAATTTNKGPAEWEILSPTPTAIQANPVLGCPTERMTGAESKEKQK